MREVEKEGERKGGRNGGGSEGGREGGVRKGWKGGGGSEGGWERERERGRDGGWEMEREGWRERETIQVTKHYTIQTYPHIYSTIHRVIISRYRLTIIPLKGRSVVATAGKQYHHIYTLNDSVY